MVTLPVDVQSVIDREEALLSKLFSEYCDGSMMNERRLREERYLQFARDVKLCPGLLPRVEAVQVFRAMKSKAEDARPEWNGRRRNHSLSLADFGACLAATAAIVFSGDDDKTFAQKFLQLLHFLRQQKAFPEKKQRPSVVGTTHTAKTLVLRTPRTIWTTEKKKAFSAVVARENERKTSIDAALKPKLRRLFHYFCTSGGHRLNVGPSASLTRLQCVRLLEHCGCLASPRLRERVDVAIAARGRRVDFDGLVTLLESIASDVLSSKQYNDLNALLDPKLDLLDGGPPYFGGGGGAAPDDNAAGSNDTNASKKDDDDDDVGKKVSEERHDDEETPKKQQGTTPVLEITGTPEKRATSPLRTPMSDVRVSDVREELSSPRDDIQRDDAWPAPRFRFFPTPTENEDEPLEDAIETCLGDGPKDNSEVRAKARQHRASRRSNFTLTEPVTPAVQRSVQRTSTLESIAADPIDDPIEEAPSLASLVDAIARQLGATSVAGTPLVNQPTTTALRRRRLPFGYFDDDDLLGQHNTKKKTIPPAEKPPPSEISRRRHHIIGEKTPRLYHPPDVVVVVDKVEEEEEDEKPSAGDDESGELRALEAALVVQSQRLAALQDRLTSSAPTTPATLTPTTVTDDVLDEDRIFAVVPVAEPVDRT